MTTVFLICDGCGFEVDLEKSPAHDKQALRRQAIGYGWITAGDEDYCPNCFPGWDCKDGNKIKCKKCNRPPTPHGHDPCIADLPCVKAACCGHGIKGGFITFRDGRTYYFEKLRR